MSFRYYNTNNGEVVERDEAWSRLENLPNWVRVNDDEHLDELRKGNYQFGRGNLLGSSSVGDREQPHHKVPVNTSEPRVEFTEPSKTQLPDQHPEPEEFHPEKQPEVITVDPSQQVQPKTGENKRDLRAVVLDENLDMNPNAAPIGGGEGGVLSRAHPELEGVEERRQQLISEQQSASEPGDPNAGHGAPAVDPDVNSTKGKGLDPADRPARSAAKSEWVDWAVKCGGDRDEANSMTKADLIEIYGD